MFEFLGNPEAMQFTHVDASLKECRQRIAVHERQRRRCGYAPWTEVLKDNGRLIGWGGLYNDPFDPGWVWNWGTISIRMFGAMDMAANLCQPHLRKSR